ncbi:MAG: hypothetical protein WD872_00300 [Pirellulaceae bacterium]
MKRPKCTTYPPSTRYKRVVVRSLWYDNDGLTIEVQGPGFVFARVIFRLPAGFRVLDERDLCEFWHDYHTGNGWLYEVHEGGWQELESHRQHFNSPSFHNGLREFLVVCDTCVSVLTVEPPNIIDQGADPENSVAD